MAMCRVEIPKQETICYCYMFVEIVCNMLEYIRILISFDFYVQCSVFSVQCSVSKYNNYKM